METQLVINHINDFSIIVNFDSSKLDKLELQMQLRQRCTIFRTGLRATCGRGGWWWWWEGDLVPAGTVWVTPA